MNKTCRQCNQLNPPEAAFCLNCAAPLGQFRQAAEQNFTQNSGGGASQRAIAALVLAIAGILCCGPFTSIPAIIVGWMEINAIKQGQSSPDGKGMANIGLWGGVAATILHLGGYLFWVIISLSAASDPYYY